MEAAARNLIVRLDKQGGRLQIVESQGKTEKQNGCARFQRILFLSNAQLSNETIKRNSPG